MKTSDGGRIGIMEEKDAVRSQGCLERWWMVKVNKQLLR